MIDLNTDTLLPKIEEIAKIGHWYIDLENDSLYWSDEVYRIHGVNREYFTPDVSKGIQFYHPEDRNEVVHAVSQAIEKGQDFTFELRLIKASGEIRYVRSMGECRKDESGKVRGVFGLFLDITDFKNTETSLRNANNFLELMLESIPDIVFVKDEYFVIQQANSKFLELYPPEQRDKVIGSTTVENYSQEDKQIFLAEDRRTLAEGYSEQEETIHFPKGETKTLLTKKVRFEDENGNPFVLGIARDITRRKEMENQLRRSNKQLEEFAYIACHDMKAPMQQIAACSEIIMNKYADNLPEEARDYLDIMGSASKKMQQMLDDLLAFARLEAAENEKEKISVKQAAEEALIQIRKKVRQSNAQITLDIGENVITAGNATLLRQFFQNLFDNSLKYHEEGQTPIINVTCRQDDGSYICRIEDNGIGIDPRYAERIFQMFRRLHAEDSPYEGSGIGLAFCKQIIRHHGGDIWLDPEYKDGTAFIFTLPRATAS